VIPLLLTALCAAAVAFFLVWLISTRVKNYGFLDVIWSYSVAFLAPFYALTGPGPPLRKWLFALVGMAWSLRLGTYILRRVLRHHPHEDVRYTSLRERWPGPFMFLLFFEIQAIIAVTFGLPFLFASFNDAPQLHLLEIAGLALSALSLAGEATADLQMSRFKADPANKGKVCESGLWTCSRHPNYFFEFLVWCGFFVAALPQPHGWISFVCPLMMFHFLYKVTGIPLTEKHSLASKGDAYRDYQRRVSAFIPWFPKKTA